MKNKHILILFLLGCAGVVAGALFKIMHWSGADVMLIAAMGLQGLCLAIFLFRLIFSSNR